MDMESGNQDEKIKKFSINERVESFGNAFSGIRDLLKYQHNIRIHLAILCLVIIAGFFFRISKGDWMAIALAAGLVLAGEAFNSAVEYLSDIVCPEFDERIKRVKDVAAAGVLISAIASVIVGIIVFLPEIKTLFST
jgi:diacylglycerol kinase (ATP)